MFFFVDCDYVIYELRKRTGLKKIAHFAEIPSVDDMYRFWAGSIKINLFHYQRYIELFP